MKAPYLWVVAVCLLLNAVTVLAQDSAAQVRLETTAVQVGVGETFAVSIEVFDAVGIYGGSIELTFDPQRFTVIAVDNQALVPGSFFADRPGMTLKNTVVEGRVAYAITLRQPAEPVNGSGTLGTVQFQALSAGPAQINLTEARLLAPEFREVNGRKIASSVNEIAVQVQGIDLEVGGGMVATQVLQIVATAAPQVVPTAQVVVPTAPQRIPAPQSRTPVPAMIAGLVFFVLGLAMFMLSVVSYTRLRQQFSVQ
jgi:hypothetical protein